MSFEAFRSVAEIVAFLGVGVYSLAHLLTRFRGGINMAEDEALTLAKDTVAFYREKVSALEADLANTRQELGTAQGQLTALQEENSELRALIMGDKVPAALASYLTDSTASLIARLETSERVLVGAMRAQMADFTDTLTELLEKYSTKPE